MNSIALKSPVKIGVVPAHLKFVGGLVPEENGDLPRNNAGEIKVVANLKKLRAESPVEISVVEVPYFDGVKEESVAEMVSGLHDQGLEVHFILMVGGFDPMDPTDEDKTAEFFVKGLKSAIQNGVKHVGSPSVEAWMAPGAKPKTGAELDAAIAQLAKVHVRAYQEAGLEGSCVDAWHIEFLRNGEFQTFTDLPKLARAIRAMNESLGKTYFKALVDAAHCGDSELSIEENAEAIRALAERDELGVFHASTKTTRGCFSTDDGWIGALLTAAAATGKLEYVVVEMFHHQDDALAPLRELDPRHGIDTTDGRDYDQVVIDGLRDVGHRLNNLVNRGIFN